MGYASSVWVDYLCSFVRSNYHREHPIYAINYGYITFSRSRAPATVPQNKNMHNRWRSYEIRSKMERRTGAGLRLEKKFTIGQFRLLDNPFDVEMLNWLFGMSV